LLEIRHDRYRLIAWKRRADSAGTGIAAVKAID
jgi:hypothetical protein